MSDDMCRDKTEYEPSAEINEDVECPCCGAPGVGNDTDHRTYGCWELLFGSGDCRVTLFVPEGQGDYWEENPDTDRSDNND